LHLIQYSPLTNVELPRIKKPKIEIFTDEEIARIKEVLKEYKYRLYKDYFLTLMYTGARPSEILALQFSNIKVERNTVYICRNRKNLNGEVYGAPKTAAGMREIPIPEELTRELIKSHQNEKISDLNGLLFKTVYGHSVSLERIEKAWQSIRKAAKIPKGKTLYTFRHTYATKLLSSNISPMEVARLMGHSNPSITFNRYGHCIPNYNEVILKKISNLY
jgi:integrase